MNKDLMTPSLKQLAAIAIHDEVMVSITETGKRADDYWRQAFLTIGDNYAVPQFTNC